MWIVNCVTAMIDSKIHAFFTCFARKQHCPPIEVGCLTQTKYSTYMYMYIICTTSNAYIWVFVRRWWLYSPGKCVLFEASWMSEFSAVKCGWRCWCDTWWMCVGRGRVNCRWVLLFCCSSLFSTDIFCMNSSHNRWRRLSTGHTQCTRYRRPCPYDPPHAPGFCSFICEGDRGNVRQDNDGLLCRFVCLYIVRWKTVTPRIDEWEMCLRDGGVRLVFASV